jgi:hypothetical protein
MCQCLLPLVEIMSHVWICGVERGGLEEGVGPAAFGKQGS